uniref:Uncharacterized protein n=2 Tax=Aegilops tauschii subsp. strangulata TaxID=200361 RepID=A0A453EEK8_AEGTS
PNWLSRLQPPASSPHSAQLGCSHTAEQASKQSLSSLKKKALSFLPCAYTHTHIDRERQQQGVKQTLSPH